MTPDQLDEIELRAAAATREPWHVEYFGDNGYPQRIANDAAILVADTHEGGGHPARTAEFIAAARTDVPRLLLEIRRLRVQLAAEREKGIAEGRQQAAADIRAVDVQRVARLEGDTVRVGLTVAARAAGGEGGTA